MSILSNVCKYLNDISSPNNTFCIELSDKTVLQDDVFLDCNSFPVSLSDFKPWHYKALRRLDKHPEVLPFSGLLALEVDMPRFICFALSNNLIRLSSYEESLYLIKNNDLKTILKANRLKISGNKNELVYRIISSVDENIVKNSNCFTRFYLLTQKGTNLIEKSYAIIAAEYNIYFETAINLIMNFHITDAYKIICKRNAETPSRNLAFDSDWKTCYFKGLPHKKLVLFASILKNSAHPLITSAALFSILSGERNNVVAHRLQAVFDCSDSESELVSTEAHYICTELDFLSYKEYDISEYKFVASSDCKTCNICRELNGKTFPIKFKKIGLNCPPMHLNCRCTTVAFNNK